MLRTENIVTYKIMNSYISTAWTEHRPLGGSSPVWCPINNEPTALQRTPETMSRNHVADRSTLGENQAVMRTAVNKTTANISRAS